MQTLLSLTFFLCTLQSVVVANEVNSIQPRAISACLSIEKKLSGDSKVFYLGASNYLNDGKHYMISSSQFPSCVVEVGSTDDTSEVIKIIGSSRSPFAIIAGGHASNQGFSSTNGILISLVRLKGLTTSSDKSSVVLGTGNVWANDVYPRLDGSGVQVVGGRVTGPAVGGVTLGGGFSWLTNQYGLACDTILSYTLVLPNGTISEVGPQQPDLFFALKGGLNRFGIVTQITFKLFPQTAQVYGGYQVFPPSSIPAVIKATQDFSSTNTDPKAQIILSLAYLAGVPNAVVLPFYDGPTRPASLDPFTKIPALINDVSTRSFASFAKSSPSQATANQRGAFHTLSTTGYTQAFIEAVFNETKVYGALAAAHTGVYISYDVEPFLTNYGQKATDSAYPHGNSPLPLNLYYSWLSPTEDAFWRGKMQQSVDYLTSLAQKEGIYNVEHTAYPNYALSTYGGDKLYGATNAARLRTIKAQIDPQGVMDLTGGFKI